MSAERRYPTDLTDRQWELVKALLPDRPPGPAGRPAKHEKREIVNAILYLVRGGGSWRMLPKDFPPWKTVYGYFSSWRDDGTLDKLHDALREQVRVKEERRNPDPSAGIVDSQSVKGADCVRPVRQVAARAVGGTLRRYAPDARAWEVRRSRGSQTIS